MAAEVESHPETDSLTFLCDQVPDFNYVIFSRMRRLGPERPFAFGPCDSAFNDDRPGSVATPRIFLVDMNAPLAWNSS